MPELRFQEINELYFSLYEGGQKSVNRIGCGAFNQIDLSFNQIDEIRFPS